MLLREVNPIENMRCVPFQLLKTAETKQYFSQYEGVLNIWDHLAVQPPRELWPKGTEGNHGLGSSRAPEMRCQDELRTFMQCLMMPPSPTACLGVVENKGSYRKL